MKRFYLEFESNRIICGSNIHIYGYASTLKTARGYISRCRKIYANDNPRNFRIFDTQADVPEDEPVPCIYSEN